jgi:hypothetical protein
VSRVQDRKGTLGLERMPVGTGRLFIPSETAGDEKWDSANVDGWWFVWRSAG